MHLHTLVPLLKPRKRVGRGGKLGGTSGKGHKGQKARTGAGGKIRTGFEGGQMPLYRRVPKRGFSNALFQECIEIVNIGRLNDIFKDSDLITKDILIQKGIVGSHKSQSGFKLKILGSGVLTKKFIIHADFFSKKAKEVIVSLGGQANLLVGEIR